MRPSSQNPCGIYEQICDFSFNKFDVSFSCFCPVIDHEFRHNIVKVAVDPQRDRRVDPQASLTML